MLKFLTYHEKLINGSQSFYSKCYYKIVFYNKIKLNGWWNIF